MGNKVLINLKRYLASDYVQEKVRELKYFFVYKVSSERKSFLGEIRQCD